jgi:hypothetical protein
MRNSVRPKWMAGALFALPLLLGAQGRGCGAATVPGPAPADAAAACQSQVGEHCGGNTAHPCTCGSGLVCTPGTSGLPFGDVGGTCQSPSNTNTNTDAGGAACVSKQGEHCGGNIAHPCTCAADLVCTAAGSGPPVGDVGGTCQAPAVDAGAHDAAAHDAGAGSAGSGNAGSHAAGAGSAGSGNAGSGADAGACVSHQDEHCGGNTSRPCTCAVGLECAFTLGGPAPGDVGGTCKPSTSASKCSTQADCRLESDYCTGCDCVALSTGESVKPCPGPGVRCLVDPCASKSVACESGSCVVH